MKNEIYIVLDLEATCYDRNDSNIPVGFQNEIIEIGAVKLNSEGVILDTFSKFLKPSLFPQLSEFCKTLTTITQDDINNADESVYVLSEFFEWSFKEDKNQTVFVSWGHYDRKQFQSDLAIYKLNTQLINESNHVSLKHKHAEWNHFKGGKGLGLGRACKHENIIFEGTAHRGIDDAKNVAKIFQKYLHKFPLNYDKFPLGKK